MKLFNLISEIIILILLTAVGNAQENDCTVNRSFPVKKGTTLKISNKYGDVNVITVKDDLLSVCATIRIVQDNKDMIRKSLKLVTIDVKQIKDTIYLSTNYDKKFFSEDYREGRKSFSVDYLIKTPAYMDLSIKDEFGNITLDEISGALNLRLSQGMLTAKKLTRGNIKPVSSVFVDHGKINISELNWMTMTIVNCPSVYIDKAQALRITSSISKINVNEIGSLVCDSKSDSYNIKSINNFMIEGVYSTFDTGLLKSQLKAKSLYGTINIQEISNYFRLIDITGGQTFISLRPVADCSFKADVLTTDAEAVFPSQKYPGIERTSSNYTTTLKGFTGADKESKSQITIRATGGKVTFK